MQITHLHVIFLKADYNLYKTKNLQNISTQKKISNLSIINPISKNLLYNWKKIKNKEKFTYQKFYIYKIAWYAGKHEKGKIK